jgi:hypothetical protein
LDWVCGPLCDEAHFLKQTSLAQKGQSPTKYNLSQTDQILEDYNAQYRNDEHLLLIMALQPFSGSH